VKSEALHEEDLHPTSHRGVRHWLPILLWLVFAGGLITEALSPHLKIENDAFVIPPSMVDDGKNTGSKSLDPAAIVMHAKHMQELALFLTLGGGVGLGLFYLPFLIGRRSA
jgi:hypothetical protein